MSPSCTLFTVRSVLQTSEQVPYNHGGRDGNIIATLWRTYGNMIATRWHQSCRIMTGFPARRCYNCGTMIATRLQKYGNILGTRYDTDLVCDTFVLKTFFKTSSILAADALAICNSVFALRTTSALVHVYRICLTEVRLNVTRQLLAGC